MSKIKRFTISYLEERFKKSENVMYDYVDENENGFTKFTTIFKDVDGKYYKMEYSIDNLDSISKNPWETLEGFDCIEMEKATRLRHCADGRSGVYFEIYEEDWVEVNED